MTARPNRMWTAEDDAAIVEGYRRCERISSIADRLGCTRNQIIGRAHRLGLQIPLPRSEVLGRFNRGEWSPERKAEARLIHLAVWGKAKTTERGRSTMTAQRDGIPFHPIANCFPLIDGQEFEELVADIKANGVREPVILYEGQILDGRNRYRASQIAGVDCPLETYSGSDPVGYAVSLNLRRRHLSEGQRAWVAAQLANLGQGARTDLRANLHEVSAGQAAELLNVSERSVKSARVVRDHGAEELQDKVAKGEVAPSTAADVARLSKEEQRAIVARGEREILEAAKRIRAEKAVERRAERIERIEEISKGNAPLLTPRRYPIILADPPWRYEQPPMGDTNRSIENHYPTMSLDEICALPVSQIAAEDCLLFLWATAPKLYECMKVVDAWGFEYRTNSVWVKDKIGMGYYFRNQHELLLVCRRGEMPPPDAGTQPSSVITAPRLEHSAKPVEVYEIIERLYPSVGKIELFSRSPRDGWASWGNQAEAAA